jgi:hypothetical protein
MMTLRDLVLKVQDASVVEAVARLHDQRETEWLPEAIVDVLSQLRELTPDSIASEFELHIELTAPIDPDDQPYWDVSCSKPNDPERYGLDLSRWEEWLAIRVPQSLLDKLAATDIVAHCVWDMTFYGFTQERIAETRAELDRRMKEIDEGKAELIPWEDVKERLRAKFGSRKESEALHDESSDSGA